MSILLKRKKLARFIFVLCTICKPPRFFVAINDVHTPSPGVYYKIRKAGFVKPVLLSKQLATTGNNVMVNLL
jgi:hypothetical protein